MPLANEGLRDFDALPSFGPRTTTPATELPQALPVDIMDRFPRPVDMSIPITEERNIQLADGIMTFLSMYNHSFMVDFFNLENPSEFFCRKTKDLYESSELIIKRNTNVVTVGWCTMMKTEPEMVNGVLRKARLFKDYETIVKFCIQDAGDWTPMSAQDELTGHEWNTEPQMVELVGSKAARMLLTRQEWIHGEGVTIKTATDDHFEQTTDSVQPTDNTFQRTSALFRQAQEKGDIFQLSAADQVVNTTPEEHHVVKSRSRVFRDRFIGNRGTKDQIPQVKVTAPEVGSHPMDSLVFQTNALDAEDTNDHATEEQFVQAHGDKASAAKTQVIEGRVMKKRTIEDLFAQAWSIPRKEAPATKIQAMEGQVVKKRTIEDLFAHWVLPNKKAKDKAKGNKATNTPTDNGHIVKNPTIAYPVRRSSKTKTDSMEEIDMKDLGRTV